MKKIVIILSLFFYFNGISQKNTYKLVKDGENYPKLKVYLYDTVKVDKIAGKIIFTSGSNQFIHDSEKMEFCKLDEKNIKKMNFLAINQLYQIENEEFGQRSLEIEKKTGHKPIAPLEHKILRVFVVLKKVGYYEAYETKSKLGDNFD